MLQNLLTERFNLKLRHELRDEPIYELVVDQNPPKVLPHPLDDGVPAQLKPGDKPGELVFQNLPISRLVRALSGETGRAVVDKTGLEGSYDFKLQWERTSRKPGQESSTDDVGVPVLKAIREQLGLKLVSSRGPVEHYTIEHVEKLRPN
jgi:uncharacterized protein (TIGR03435 family)